MVVELNAVTRVAGRESRGAKTLETTPASERQRRLFPPSPDSRFSSNDVSIFNKNECVRIANNRVCGTSAREWVREHFSAGFF